jgi:hypothetical protein
MQKAIFVTEIGKPLVLGTRLVPETPKGCLLIKVQSTMCEELLPSLSTMVKF